ncbi:putative methyltransferase DDB_G0268948 isoform X1 [Aplysia californica]|uniref:Methyltransferase DDB_G0268948 isoform X1 n=1 Tax=Aplysia californica TaxID=6500 RepID=A0ABM1A846_APLCA|nr:putative methyltransferase DDB_G0268948 isoform X1 [Aplysia californica]
MSSTSTSGSTPGKSSNPYDVEEIINHYREHRPTYAQEVFETIQAFCEENKAEFDLALDIACGSGQATVPLAGIYKQAIGVDASASHVAKAPRHLSNITYKVADCNFPLNFIESGTVDLVSVASAVHWLDLNNFYAETDRMLKPGGVMAVFCGGFPSYEDQEVLSIYKKILATTGETHPEQMKVANDNMESFRLPYPNSKRFLPINRHLEATAEQSIQMSLTIHSFQDYVQKHPEYMEEVRQMFREWNKGDESKTYKFAVPTYLLTSQKPTQ